MAGACCYDAAFDGFPDKGYITENIEQFMACRLVIEHKRAVVDEAQFIGVFVGNSYEIGYTVKLGLRIGIVGLYNIQFILDENDEVYVIEVNPRSSRTVPFLSKSTGVPMAHIATQVILGKSLREQGITEVYGREKERWYVKAPAFSFAKIRGMESYLSPEMKSTGEAIGYDNKLTRALYKALQSSGMTVANYGTIFLTIADKDKQDALPLVRRFYDLGFNICLLYTSPSPRD